MFYHHIKTTPNYFTVFYSISVDQADEKWLNRWGKRYTWPPLLDLHQAHACGLLSVLSICGIIPDLLQLDFCVLCCLFRLFGFMTAVFSYFTAIT